MDDSEMGEMIDFLAKNPEAGAVIEGTGGLRKLRWARNGRGKSAGYRVIYYFHDQDAPIYTFLVYGKGKQANLTAEQKKTVRKFVDDLKKSIRDEQGIGRKAK